MRNLLVVLCSLSSLSVVAQSTSTVQILNAQTLKPVAAEFRVGSRTAELQFTDDDGKIPEGTIKVGDSLFVNANGFESFSGIFNGSPILLSEKIVLVNKTETIRMEYLQPTVVISATRFAEKRDDVPQQVTTITRNDIQFQSQQTTADLLQQTGTVLVQKSQAGGGSPMIRGFEASRVLMVIDGVRLNNAIYRAGHLQNIITIDQTMLDRVEVFAGPGSVVYGSDALGGVMCFYTRKPEFSGENGFRFKGSAFSRYSTANQEKTGHVDFNFGWAKFASLTSVTYSDFGDVRAGNIRNPFYGDWGKATFYTERINDVDSMIQNP
ncbi:MAG: TonB-dependent receptor plug domain-containing protein, partial [Bacteroidia bacterium]|nr:TonB-dependent receptor plug domain-containing protein [Bacteroidia bacterium]